MIETHKKNEKKDEGSAWKILPAVLQKVFGTVENFAEHLLNAAEHTAQDFVRRGIEKLVSFFIVAVGTLFLAVGVAMFLTDFFQFPGSGPLIIGGAFLLIGLFFMLSRRA